MLIHHSERHVMLRSRKETCWTPFGPRMCVESVPRRMETMWLLVMSIFFKKYLGDMWHERNVLCDMHCNMMQGRNTFTKQGETNTKVPAPQQTKERGPWRTSIVCTFSTVLMGAVLSILMQCVVGHLASCNVIESCQVWQTSFKTDVRVTEEFGARSVGDWLTSGFTLREHVLRRVPPVAPMPRTHLFCVWLLVGLRALFISEDCVSPTVGKKLVR